jgi:hypothetical protein
MGDAFKGIGYQLDVETGCAECTETGNSSNYVEEDCEPA